ncbi:MAG: WXG100 family type VII secretion target [Blautia sp.]|nr:WXG100 family type VII secretion target [Blautia sp.]
MAAEIRVTSAALRSRREELEQANGQFRELLERLESTVGMLAASWEGESHDAFYQAFKEDRGKMDLFSDTVRAYGATLDNMINKYEAAEKANTILARSRA